MIVASSFVKGLQDIMRTLLESIFVPIITQIMEVVTRFLGGILWSIFGEFFLDIFITLLSVIDFIEEIFNIFSGLRPVFYNGSQTDLLSLLIQKNETVFAFAAITLMSIGICFGVTAYKTAKSISDMALDDRNPISKILKNGFRASCVFMLTPFLCIFFLHLASVVTIQVNSAFYSATGGVNTSVGNILFLTASMNADRKTMPNRDPFEDLDLFRTIEGRNPRFDDAVRRPYLVGNQLYKNLDRVKADFYPTEFDYVTGFVSAIVVLFILTGAVLYFIRRLFEILLLYLVAPLFASTIPADDGMLFKKWREVFIAKFFSGFGIIFSMKYFLMLIPMIGGSELVLYSGTSNAYIINNILKVFLIIGGAWAIYKSQHLILQIISPDSAMAAREANIVTSGLLLGIGSGGFRLGKMAVGGAIKQGSNRGANMKNSRPEEDNNMEDMTYDQAFRGR